MIIPLFPLLFDQFVGNMSEMKIDGVYGESFFFFSLKNEDSFFQLLLSL